MNERRSSLATEILLEETAGHDAATWLVPGGEAALACGLAAEHPGAQVRWQAIDVRELGHAAIRPANLLIAAPGAPGTGVDAVVIAGTPDRGLVRRWLLAARRDLAPDGRLFIAGANTEGIRPVIGDAGKLFGVPRAEGYRSKQRFAVFGNEGAGGDVPGWATDPGVEPGTWLEFDFEFRGQSMPLVTQAGVFAGGRIDPGTQLLLDALPERIDGRVLDAGCGAGVIGIGAAMLGAEQVDLTDANLLAVQAARENVLHRDVFRERMRVLPGDVFSAVGDMRYDLIVSNPPFHRGKVIDYDVADRLISGAPAHLADGGALLVVANGFLAYGKRMAKVFREVETIAANRHYHVLWASDPR